MCFIRITNAGAEHSRGIFGSCRFTGEVIDKNRSEPGSPRPYKDFNYASFTGWTLEWALESCEPSGESP